MGYSGASANGNWRLERDWNGRYLRNAVCILVACRWLYTVQCGEMPQQQSLAVDLSILSCDEQVECEHGFYCFTLIFMTLVQWFMENKEFFFFLFLFSKRSTSNVDSTRRFNPFYSLQASSTRKSHPLHSRVISEPADLLACALVDQRRRQTAALFGIEDLLHDILLSSTGSNVSDAERMGDDRQGEGDALRGRLGRVVLSTHPGVLFAQQLMPGEQTAGVAIRTAAQEDEVEHGQLDAVLGSKSAHQILLVRIGDLLRVVVGLNRVHRGSSQLCRNLADQLLFEETVVAVRVVEGHVTLVREEDIPLGELRGVFGGAIAGG